MAVCLGHDHGILVRVWQPVFHPAYHHLSIALGHHPYQGPCRGVYYLPALVGSRLYLLYDNHHGHDLPDGHGPCLCHHV